MPEQWEISRVTFYDGLVLAEGWEPFAASGYVVWVKRRVVAEMVRPLPASVLSAEERAVLRRRQVAGQ